MSAPTYSKTSDTTQVTTSTEASPATRDRLATGEGQISVAEGVVQKIAGKACREISGVHSMGTGSARAFGALLELERDDDLIDLEFNAICRRRDYPMIEVPIFSTRRHGGRSTTSYGSALALYVGAYGLFRAMRRHRA